MLFEGGRGPAFDRLETADWLYINVVFKFNCFIYVVNERLKTNQDLLGVEPFSENI